MKTESHFLLYRFPFDQENLAFVSKQSHVVVLHDRRRQTKLLNVYFYLGGVKSGQRLTFKVVTRSHKSAQSRTKLFRTVYKLQVTGVTELFRTALKNEPIIYFEALNF